MDGKNLTYTVTLENLQLEAVLDKGFPGELSFSDEVHAHAYYELVQTLSGTVCIESPSGLRLQLTAGEACLIPSGFYHRLQAATADAGKLAVRFHCVQAGSGSLYSDFSRVLSSHNVPIYLGSQPRLQRCLQELRQELHTPGIMQEPYLQGLLIQSFCLLLRQLLNRMQDPAAPAAEDLSRRLQLEEYLQEHFHESITEAALAEHMHLSKRQLSRVIRGIYGTSFRRLLIDTRLNHAAQLLIGTTLPVEEIASRCGYTSLSGFYEAFRKYSGTTAGQYRKAYESSPQFR